MLDGCGSGGSGAAVELLLAGCCNLSMNDNDRVSLSGCCNIIAGFNKSIGSCAGDSYSTHIEWWRDGQQWAGVGGRSESVGLWNMMIKID